MQQIDEPKIDSATLDGWQLFILRTTFQGAGFMVVEIADMDGVGAPVVKAGSRFEINGAFYKATADETPGGAPASGMNYVYAIPNSSGASIQYSATAPVFSAAKGGWYNGDNNRAVLRFLYDNGAYYNKEILDSRQGNKSMSGSAIQQKKILSGVVGTLIRTITPTSTLATRHFRLEPGTYCFDVAGAGGGGGGGGASDNEPEGGTKGGDGMNGEVSYIAALGYLLMAWGGAGAGGGTGGGTVSGKGGGTGGADSNLGAPGGLNIEVKLPEISGIRTSENENQIATKVILGGAGGPGRNDGRTGGDGSDGAGGGNNRNTSVGGGAQGTPGTDYSATDNSSGRRGGAGAGGRIIESVVIVDPVDFISAAGNPGIGESGHEIIGAYGGDRGAGGTGSPGWIRIYKVA
jgi:hypothetical protein